MPASTPDVAPSSVTYRGLLYRALNPLYAADPLSGRGAELFGGRFNARGVPALYLSLTPATAIREANQVGTLQPTMLLCYAADIARVFDARDATLLSTYDADPASIADPAWRDRMRDGGPAPTRALAARLVSDGYSGLLVRSFAKGAVETDLDLVLWAWTPSSLRVIDDEGRLRNETPAGS